MVCPGFFETDVTINGQFQFEGSNYRRKERKKVKHLLLHGDVIYQQDSIGRSCIKLFFCKADDGLTITDQNALERVKVKIF